LMVFDCIVARETIAIGVYISTSER